MTTRDFYLTGAQGSFRLPAGESRIGSDAACEICIHGEGILPVHAYLRADTGKVLIRPASNEAVSVNDRVAITVGGSLITGPSSILEGQGVTIGGVQMTLMREQEKRQSLFSRAWIRWTAYGAVGLFALAMLAFIYVRYVYLDEEALKTRIRDAVHQALGRPVEDVEVGSVKVRFFDGRFDVQNFKIKERVDFQSAQSSYFVQLPNTVVTFDLWSYVKSFGREIRKMEIVADGDGIQNPELIFERSKTDGTLNAEDILGGLGSASKFSWKLTHLDFALKFSNAAVRLRDPYTSIGETSLEKINIDVRLPGPGMPMRIDRFEMVTKSIPASPDDNGSLMLTGRVNLLDENCMVIPDRISAEGVTLDGKNFDLARIFEHLGYAWEPHNANFKVVLGKPIQGHLDIALASARELKLQGNLTSSSLLSIKEEKLPPLGNIPMELKIADLHLVKDPEKNGGRFVPTSLDMRLESWLDPAKRESAFLTFSTNGKLNSSGKYNYSLDLVCGLQELLNTDVGKRLKLDGTLGGGLEGHAELVVEPGQGLGIDARLNGKNTFVMVPVPEDVNKPRDKWRMMKQPLPLTFDCFVDARQAENGGIAYIDVQRFLLNASSFKAHSDKPMRIDVRSVDEKIKADAQFQLDLKGKEFCREFSPILSLFGFTKSLDEDFDLKITVFGRNDVLGMLTDGKMTRKWSSDPAPVRLKTSLVYNKPALARGEIPYLSMIVLAATSGDKPIELQVEAHCTRRDGRDIIDCVSLDKDGKDTGAPGVIVNADIETLRGRFQPYIEQALQFREGSKTDALWLKFYQDAVLKGEVSQNARIRILRASNEGANETDRIEFDLKTNTNFKSSVELAKLAPQKMETSPLQPPSPKARFDWEEPKMSVELKGVYEQSVSNNPEEAERLRMLNVERLNFKGSLGQFELGLKNLDLLALPTIRGAGNKEWTDALAGMSIRGTVAPQAAVLLKSLGILDPDDPVSGTINLEAAYEREKDSLDFKKFEFMQAGGFYLSELNASGSLSRVREISAQLFPAQPNRDSLTVRMANWLVKDGADVFFGHLGRELVIHKLRLEAKPFREWLVGTFKGGAGRESSALFSGILDNTFEPNGLWSADNLQLTRDQNLPNTWRLNGALQTGFLLRASGKTYEAGAPTLAFSNPWNLELGLALNKDTVAFDGEVRLENAEISATVPGVKMELGWPFSNVPGMIELKKLAKEPFKIELAGGATARGVLPLMLNKLRATGNFGSLELGHFVAEATRGSMRFGLEKFKFNGTQFQCSGSMPTLDLERDTLVARIEAPMLEVNLLPEMWVLAPNGAGRLKNVLFNYKGGLGSLLASLHPALRPKLEAGDPRRSGVNPESDSLELEGDLDGAAINLPNWALALSGRVRLTPLEMAWKNCSATLWRAPGSGAPKVVVEPVQTFSVAKLRVKSSEPKLNLRQAFSTDGMPLEISGDIECANALDDTQLVVLRDALKTLVPGSPLAGAPDFAAARRMFVTGGLKAPSIMIAGVECGGMDARNMIFKDLKLSVPLLSTTLLGGKLLLEDGEYDFSKVAARGGPVRGMKGVQHTQSINYSGADLCRLMGGAVSDPGFYSLCGRLDATGHLSGVDFKGLDRLNWNGAQKFTISNFASGAPTLDPAGEGILPALSWMSYFKHHGSKRVEVMARASLMDSISPLVLSADGSAPPAIKLADGALAGMELYFSKAFGIENGRFEFEPFTPTARIDKGLAVVEPFELKGRGMSDGFDLQVRNLKVNLADEILADEVLIFPTVLPKQAQEKLLLDKWPTIARQAFTNAMASGKLSLKISGSLDAPVFKFPWADVRALVRPALFGVDTIVDIESLSRAREHFYRTWGRDESTLQAVALLAERAGVGLPGTLTSLLLKDSIVDRAAKLPPKLMEAVNGGAGAVPLTPVESLRILLTAEFELPKLTPPVPPTTPGNSKTQTPGKEPIGKP